MKQKAWITGMVGVCFFLLAGCANMDAQPTRASAHDGVDIPSKATETGSTMGRPRRAVVTLHAVGRGIAPEDAISRGQAIILGQSAARANGYVKLAEKVHGVYVDSFRQMGRGVVDIEIVHQETQALLKGAEVLEYREVENGIFEAYMRVRIVVDQNNPLFPSGY